MLVALLNNLLPIDLHFGLGRHVDDLDDLRITASVQVSLHCNNSQITSKRLTQSDHPGPFIFHDSIYISLGLTKLTFLLQIRLAAKSRTLR
jgi:hypothetical protein